MAELTITEGLAELKTLAKRIQKKREFIIQYLGRQELVKDPLEKDGGSVEAIRRERQAISDMQSRIVSIRSAIAFANSTTHVTIEGEFRSIANWLVWRREVAPTHKQFLEQLRTRLEQARREAAGKGVGIVSAVAMAGVEAKPTDLIVNISEQAIATEIEHLETVLGRLDGVLSLKNATTNLILGD